MKNKLIKLLGGFTRDEYESEGSYCDARVETWEKIVADQRKDIQAREGEIQRLTDLILTKTGFIVQQNVSAEKIPQPVNNRKPWPRVQRELELADARKHADAVAARFEQGREGNSGNEGDGTERSSVA